MDKFTTIISSRKFQIASFLLLVILLAVSLPYPGEWDFGRDYRWLAARAYGQSEAVLRLLLQFGDLYDYNIDVSYDTLAFSQQPLNPFFILAHFTSPFLGNYLTLMFMSVISLIYCRRIAEETNVAALFPVLAAVFFLSQSFDHHFNSNLALSSLFAVPVYYVITCKILKGQKPGLLDWAIMLLGPLVMDLHAPLVLGFTVLFTSALKRKTIDFSNWSLQNTLVLSCILAIHALGWLPWLTSSSDRPEITWQMLLSFQNLFVIGPHNLHHLMAEHDGYAGIFMPTVGSGMFFYMPVGFVVVSFFCLILRNPANRFPRALYAFALALIAFAFFLSTQYVYDLLQPLSYFRYPLNMIPPLLMVASFAALYNAWPSKKLAWAYLAAFIFDFCMLARGTNDPYIYIHYALAAIILWFGHNRDRKPALTGFISLLALIYCAAMILTVLPNAARLEGKEQGNSNYRAQSLAGLQCIEDATGNKPFTTFLISGVSEREIGQGRMHNRDMAHLVEETRGFNLTSFFLYREFVDKGQTQAQKKLFNRWGGGMMPPELVVMPSVEALRTAGIQYLGLMGADWQSQAWWQKNKTAFTFKAACPQVYDTIDVYALNPAENDYMLTRKSAREWRVDAKKDMSVIIPIANRPSTRVYVNGIETTALKAYGPVTVNVLKGESIITITNTNIRHILAYAYFCFAMMAAAALGLLAMKRYRQARS